MTRARSLFPFLAAAAGIATFSMMDAVMKSASIQAGVYNALLWRGFAGTLLMLSPYITQHSPEVWPDPERFDPDRFTAEQAEGRPRFAYFPFAGGPRQCIGLDFALTEATLVVATILRHYHLEPTSSREVVPQPLITLRPRDGLSMIPRPVALPRP